MPSFCIRCALKPNDVWIFVLTNFQRCYEWLDSHVLYQKLWYERALSSKLFSANFGSKFHCLTRPCAQWYQTGFAAGYAHYRDLGNNVERNPWSFVYKVSTCWTIGLASWLWRTFHGWRGCALGCHCPLRLVAPFMVSATLGMVCSWHRVRGN
jgi:hypothetical protein